MYSFHHSPRAYYANYTCFWNALATSSQILVLRNKQPFEWKKRKEAWKSVPLLGDTFKGTGDLCRPMHATDGWVRAPACKQSHFETQKRCSRSLLMLLFFLLGSDHVQSWLTFAAYTRRLEAVLPIYVEREPCHFSPCFCLAFAIYFYRGQEEGERPFVAID